MAAGRTKVAVASPHPVVVEGFRAMLGHHPDVEAMEMPTSLSDEEPDVVLYDVVALADGNGADLDDLVQNTACVVLAVARDLRPDLLTQALNRGADGFFPLGVSPEELAAAIASATTGWQLGDAGPDPVVGSSTSEQRLHRLGEDVGLSAREVRVLSLVAQGLSNDEIAVRDYLSINTVKTYIRSAYRKIGVRSRTQAVVWAIQHGFSPDQDAPAIRGAEDER